MWKLENLGFEVRQNPIDVIRTIKFTGIIQETIREEVKRASYIRIKYLSVGSLQGEIRAVRRFSEFLAKRNPEIKSLGEVGRLNIEEYLTYINLERGQERVNTVYRYRRASGKLLVKETEELRKTMDEILSEIIKEWDGYEQVFQNG